MYLIYIKFIYNKAKIYKWKLVIIGKSTISQGQRVAVKKYNLPRVRLKLWASSQKWITLIGTLNWIGNDQSMKMRGISRVWDKKLTVNNNLGRALKFYASVRMEVRRIETVKTGGEATGNRVKIKIVKNKVAPPFRETEIDIVFAEGISKLGDLLDVATEYDVINKSGAWYSYNGEKIGQGREKAKQYLEEHPEIIDEIRTSTLEAVEAKKK